MAAKPLIIEPQFVLLEPNQYKLSKSSVDYLLRTNSPRVQLVPKTGKSDVWQRFSTIRVDGNEVDFCACHHCGGVVTFTKKSGTNGMRTHRCKERRSDVSNNVTLTVTPTNYQNRTNLIVMPTSSGIRVGNDNKSQWPANIAKSDKKNMTVTPIINNSVLTWTTPTTSTPASSTPRKKLRKSSKIKNDENGFEVDVDCCFFKPNELTVKTLNDDLVIHGEHEERKDDLGYIKRQFTRRIPIPCDVEPEKLTSSFHASGILTVKAPKKCLNDTSKERIIPITWSNNDANADESDKYSDSENGQNEGSVIIEDEVEDNEEQVAAHESEVTTEEPVLP